ncbi:MAG: glycosyltransferase [Candidatus Aureabacteria bacterium]|nr:glycosyltransferase [Candidatus Auribacterota bacterium]
MRISLIVPVYNAEKHLPDLFASITYQTRPFDEIILVDNNSHDSSLELCENFRAKNSQKAVLTSRERIPGPGAARNRGINMAKGDILCFTDADCVLEKDFAGNVESFFMENGSIDILSGVALSENPLREKDDLSLVEEFSLLFWSGERTSGQSFPLNSKSGFFSDSPFYITTFNMACRRRVIEELKGFAEDVMTMEDIDFWLRACDKGFLSEAGVPNIKVFHNNRKSLSSLTHQHYSYMHSLPWILKKHFPGRFVFAYRMRKLFSFSLFTGLLEINPHTILLALIIVKFSWLPFFLAVLILYRVVAMARFLSKISAPSVSRSFAFGFIMELRHLAMTCGAIAGSIRHKALCIL